MLAAMHCVFFNAAASVRGSLMPYCPAADFGDIVHGEVPGLTNEPSHIKYNLVVLQQLSR